MNLQSETDAIQIKNLSVTYVAVAEVPVTERSKMRKTTKKHNIRALNNVSFTVKTGAIVGLIGGNGAGKSTLLKTMVGVLKPSSGQIDMWGQPHLLAAGMGFNRKLSGRENIILGGLAAGMTLEEVRNKQQSIVDFADIGGFIDLPTTTYSSGMFGRLAFAVATHVDPDILLIDEALSAGDAGFRDKAVAKVREMCDKAKTILVVSHSTALVGEMATSAVWLHRGEVKQQGLVGDVTESYVKFLADENETAQMDREIAER